jgi:hypothetical protein
VNAPSTNAAASVPEDVARYREHYRAEHLPAHYSGIRHLTGTLGIPAAGIACCVFALRDVTLGEWLTVPATVLYANLVEYAGHRGPMHHPVKRLTAIFERHARQHHRFFTRDAMQLESAADLRAILFPLRLVVFYFGFFGLPLAALLAWIASGNVAVLFLATALAYYLNYEILHLAWHLRPDGGLGALRVLRRLHLYHHDPALMQAHNFNITYPVGDLLFGTLYRGGADEDGAKKNRLEAVGKRGTHGTPSRCADAQQAREEQDQRAGDRPPSEALRRP